MIIRSHKRIDKFDVSEDKENLIFHHAQEISPILQKNYEERMDDNNGFVDSREFRKIASIPILDWARLEKKYPGFLQDPKLLKKVLMKEADGNYRTVRKGI